MPQHPQERKDGLYTLNTHKITKRQLHKCLRTVQDRCLSSGTWHDESFQEYCRDPHNVELLQTLSAMKAISFSSIDDRPIYAFPLDAAGTVWLENSEKWKDRIWGFVAGVATTVLAELILLIATGTLRL